jgi:hypothetical protein
MVSQELLDILRCPVCVHNQPEGGDLVQEGNWLICRDCDRKYPIRDDIPVMLIDEGDRFREVPRGELPLVPPPELEHEASLPELAAECPNVLPGLLLATAGLLLGAWLIWLLSRRRLGR